MNGYFYLLYLGRVLLGSTVSTATGLGWNVWGFPIEHFYNRFRFGWKSLSTKPIVNGFVPIEHEITQPI